VVSLLTNRALSVDEIDRAEAEQLLSQASARVPTTEQEFAAKDRDLERARRMLAMK
jgi:F0F1-type ATP synthase epsilon subunit